MSESGFDSGDPLPRQGDWLETVRQQLVVVVGMAGESLPNQGHEEDDREETRTHRSPSFQGTVERPNGQWCATSRCHLPLAVEQ